MHCAGTAAATSRCSPERTLHNNNTNNGDIHMTNNQQAMRAAHKVRKVRRNRPNSKPKGK